MLKQRAGNDEFYLRNAEQAKKRITGYRVRAWGGRCHSSPAGANVHDVKLLAVTLGAIVIPQPEPTQEDVQNLCADAEYRGETAMANAQARSYCPHLKKPPRRSRSQTH